MSDLVALALIRHLIETGALDRDDVNAIAARVEADDAMAAHQVRCELLEASAPSSAERARAKFRSIDGGNGGAD